MALTISNLSTHQQYGNVAISLVFRFQVIEDFEMLTKVFSALVKDTNLDLFFYVVESLPMKLKHLDNQKHYKLSAEIVDAEKAHFKVVVKEAFSSDVFGQARLMSKLSQEDLCMKAQIGRTTLFKLESNYNYREIMRKDSYLLVCSILEKELKQLNYE